MVAKRTSSPSRRTRARVGRERAGDDLHQRRLAGAVLPEQRVHGAGADREVRAGERDDAAVRLADASRLEHAAYPAGWLRCWSGLSSCFSTSSLK